MIWTIDVGGWPLEPYVPLAACVPRLPGHFLIYPPCPRHVRVTHSAFHIVSSPVRPLVCPLRRIRWHRQGDAEARRSDCFPPLPSYHQSVPPHFDLPSYTRLLLPLPAHTTESFFAIMNAAVTNMAVMMGAMQVAKRIPFEEEPVYIVYARVAYISAQLLVLLINFYMSMKVSGTLSVA